jgi:hypothetical protein
MGEFFETEIKIEGIIANSETGYAGGDLYVPLNNVSDLLIDYVEVTAPKVGNDADKDITTYLTTTKIFDDLSFGAWAKFHSPDSKKYYEPIFTAGTTTALAWTLHPDYPLMPGAATVDQSDADYAFKEFELFRTKMFGLDTKYGRVWRNDSETWNHYTGNAWSATILSGVVSAASNVTPIVITDVAHGLTSGDTVSIFDVLGNLGANSTSANPIWYVTVLTADTFSLYSDAARTLGVAGTGAYTSGGTWKRDATGILGNPTELLSFQSNSSLLLLVGSDNGFARQSANADGAAPTWANFVGKNGSEVAAQHFALVNADLYYSTGYIVTNRVSGKSWKVGNPETDVNRMLWWHNYLIITKPEGVWALLPDKNSLQNIQEFHNKSEHNGKVLIIHNESAYWNAGENWFRWDGFTAPNQQIATFDGDVNRVAYHGHVRGAMSDGKNLYLVYRVTTEASPRYFNDFIVVQTTKTLGYHPVFVASSTTTEPTYYVGGVFFHESKIRYSLGTAATSVTGYLMTDGDVPKSGTGKPYVWDVGITTGMVDMQRSGNEKWIRENLISTLDKKKMDTGVAGTGFARVAYRTWEDGSTFTAYPTAQDIARTNDRITETPTPETDMQAGFLATKVEWKILLKNSGNATDKENMFYVRSFHAVWSVFYRPALLITARVPYSKGGVSINANNRRNITGTELLQGLKAGMIQNRPVTVTLPNGMQALMQILPSRQTIRLENIRSDGTDEHGHFSFDARELR